MYAGRGGDRWQVPQLAGRRAAVALCIAALFVSCATPPEHVRSGAPREGAEQGSLAASYERLAMRGEPVLEVDSERTVAWVTVRRAGALAALGHDHVVASHRVKGFVAPRQGIADVAVRVDELAIDEPELRRNEGLDHEPSVADIEGTRTNMRKHVLDATNHPLVLVHVEGARPAAGEVALPVAMTVNGVTHRFIAPAQVRWNGEAMHVTGRVALLQSAFGIAPFSLLGGAIRVDDEIELRFEVVGRPIGR